ncbi:hypothetical protein DEA8626_01294 [Defluviimonas aquaemixtae]|uniref:DUF1330 domain-containing protein n=1 Tax=Albidovulum aquaemixtae TaxID=1542388 RepID=A0A2R8B5B3_9RHOB|nr:DUF1330 domain-containing protein [Defluviimonas aquaemixtae]SPH17767.1 hypothetical protein DEA8626_01294 [Defluviimonas aquaemixtae]
MSETKSALWIAHVSVTDDEAYGRYAAAATSIIAKHGGVFLARASRYQQFEGKDRARNVVARFPSFEAAVSCYNSPEYQEIAKIAKAAADRDLVVVEES